MNHLPERSLAFYPPKTRLWSPTGRSRAARETQPTGGWVGRERAGREFVCHSAAEGIHENNTGTGKTLMFTARRQQQLEEERYHRSAPAQYNATKTDKTDTTREQSKNTGKTTEERTRMVHPNVYTSEPETKHIRDPFLAVGFPGL